MIYWSQSEMITCFHHITVYVYLFYYTITIISCSDFCEMFYCSFTTDLFGRTMWVDRAWNYYHHQFWMKKRKHIFHKKGGSFQFSCVVRTTRTIPQMISSTSKEFTFRSGNVPLLCPYTGFSQPKRRIVCLVSLFIIPSVHTTIVLNK